MKKSTVANLTAVLATLLEGPETITKVVETTGLNANTVNALEGIWSWDKTGAIKPLFTRKTVGGHSFLVITEEGKAYKAPEAGAKAVRAPAMTEEAARAALLAEMTATGATETVAA